jgi:FAD-dependent urate hydroxylase
VKVVIIGAGVGGLAAAVGLLAAGHEVEVYERSDTLRVRGNGMIVWPNGCGIVESLGIPPRELGMPMDVGEQILQDGTVIFHTEYDGIAEYYGTPPMMIGRPRLVERLAGLLPEGVLNFGRECIEVRNLDGEGRKATGALAVFADGSKAEGDVLIGADGLGSIVRRTLHGARPAAYTGWAAWHGATRAPIDLTGQPKVQAFSGANGIAALHPIGFDHLFWAFETPWEEGDTVPRLPDSSGNGDTGTKVGNLKARFDSWAEPIPSLLDSIDEDDVAVFPFVRHKVPRHWGSGRMTLLGDAAHVVSPRTAQGVNQALEDAWVLAQTLRDGAGDPSAQLRAYCNTRRSKIRALTITAYLMDRGWGLKVLGAITKYAKQDSTEAMKRNMRLYSNFLKKRD